MPEQEAIKNLVGVAKSQLGYHEGQNNYNKFADHPEIQRLYGYYPQNQPWCCTFVNWCFLMAFGYEQGSRLTYGGTPSCNNSANLFKNAGAFTRTPEVGDQAFFYVNGGINHTGIVVAVSGNSFKTIEGNYSDKVSEVQHNAAASDVAGFGHPNWKVVANGLPNSQESPGSESEQHTEDQAGHTWKPATLKYGASGIDVYILQSLLIAKKFFASNNQKEIDGRFGAKTQAAVNSAKQFYGQMANGECDEPFWKRILERG